MTAEKAYLDELKPFLNSHVTFGDGAEGKIKGIGKLMYFGLPILENVLLLEDLNANLISMSQICDQSLKVIFNKLVCIVFHPR